MLLMSIALAAFASPPALATLPAVAAEEHGRLAWFQGGFDDLLAKARTEKKIVFIDFWTSW